ncbi:MAG: FISUMP domain-containing protein [Bacteroidales bacterium]
MKLNLVIYSLMALITFAVLPGCDKNGEPEKLPDLSLSAKPAKGLTTDIMEIKVSEAPSGPVDRILFYRWDWNQDGVWDTPFSTGNQLKHRFMKPGSQLISMEYSDGKKQVKTAELTILVDQGFSAPRPLFTVSPGTGNFLIAFTFDATGTADDEDSLDQLKFRWDFMGDGRWTQQYTASPTATYQYKLAGVYNPKVEVRDPSGRSATFSREVVVDMRDSLIIPDFTINDTLIRVGDTLILDASGSYHSKDINRELLFSWMLPERVEWTNPETAKTRELIVNQKGDLTIGLRVVDKETKLYNQVSKDFIAADQNLPPKAMFQVGPLYGNILTQFYFDCWLSTDDTQAPSDLEVRWDFDGDGNWDTPFNLEKTLFHQFDQPGEYYTTIQVRDKEGVRSLYKKRLFVSGNTNQTGFFKDKRDDNYYGTVKIGNQWWMSQNLNFMIPKKQASGVKQWQCLYEQSKWCDQAGKMYRVGAVIENRSDNEYTEICPLGWRLPSKEDWETLFSSLGGEQNVKELRYGGKADFNAQDLGYGDYYFLWKPGIPIPYDTVYEFHETFQKSWFFSTTGPFDPNHVRTDIWEWSTGRDGVGWMGFGSVQLYMPVRCVKED